MENMGGNGSGFKEQKKYVFLFHICKSHFELFELESLEFFVSLVPTEDEVYA